MRERPAERDPICIALRCRCTNWFVLNLCWRRAPLGRNISKPSNFKVAGGRARGRSAFVWLIHGLVKPRRVWKSRPAVARWGRPRADDIALILAVIDGNFRFSKSRQQGADPHRGAVKSRVGVAGCGLVDGV